MPDNRDATIEADLDPGLQILFANAEKDLAPNGFVEAVLARAERARRTRIAVGFGAAAVLLVLAGLLAGPLQAGVLALTQGLTTALVPPGDGLAGQLLAPVNNVAGLLALLLVALQSLLRRVWS